MVRWLKTGFWLGPRRRANRDVKHSLHRLHFYIVLERLQNRVFRRISSFPGRLGRFEYIGEL